MCTSPIQIKNPNYRQTGKWLSMTTDVSSQYIRVPCGHCDSCRLVKQTSLFQRILLESENSYIYFVTLTYETLSLPSIEIESERFNFAPYSDFQKYVKRLRKYPIFQDRGFRYICCREYGKDKGRPHFHFLLFLKSLPNDSIFTNLEIEKQLKPVLLKEWRRNVGTSLHPLYKPICHYATKTRRGRTYRNFDCHLIKPYDGGIDDALYYVLKYISKDSALYKKMQVFLLNKYGDKTSDYYHELDKLKPKIWKSVRFGLDPITKEGETPSTRIQDLIKEMIRRSRLENSDFPLFLYKNHRFPLSRYYKSKFLSDYDLLYFHQKTMKLNGRIVYDNFDPIKNAHQAKRDELRSERIDFSDVLDVFDED